MVWIPGGSFLMGSDDHYPEEAPAHSVTVGGFWMDRHTLTNAEFARFVRKTGHVTVAERSPDPADYPGAKPELLVPASTVFVAPPHRVDLRPKSAIERLHPRPVPSVYVRIGVRANRNGGLAPNPPEYTGTWGARLALAAPTWKSAGPAAVAGPALQVAPK